ncbi:MAG: flagellar hook-basal body protein [Oscillospiraceae bacterium]|nr:flagellar hook-basal body protein [Oscillospiraceae bacterium]
MVKGFYQLTSAMLSQGRRLDVVSNNMVNVSTAGYKADRYTDSTFQNVLMSRIGNKDKSAPQELGQESYILAPSELYTDYTQGSLEETTLPLDFAIEGDGFFAIELNGQVGYTRQGSFTLDEEGYLCLGGQGRVLDNQGQPIQLPTDKIKADPDGALYSVNGSSYLGTLGIYAFQDNGALERNERGLFVGQGAAISENYKIHHKMVERSNSNMVQEMVFMMSSQRALQSAAQLSKIYDQVLTKTATDIGRL